MGKQSGNATTKSSALSFCFSRKGCGATVWQRRELCHVWGSLRVWAVTEHALNEVNWVRCLFIYLFIFPDWNDTSRFPPIQSSQRFTGIGITFIFQKLSSSNDVSNRVLWQWWVNYENLQDFKSYKIVHSSWKYRSLVRLWVTQGVCFSLSSVLA